MNKRTIVIIVIALAAIGLGGVLLFASDQTPANPPGQTVSADQLEKGARFAAGPAAAPVHIVEFGDFECPACGQQHPVLKQAMSTYGDKLQVTFREFPLPQHQYAKSAAEAAYAAGLQDKFWPMHDKLYENQEKLDDASITAYASAIGLDMNKFQQDWKAGSTADAVQADMNLGNQIGINATPTLFINGARFEGELNQAQLDSEIKSRLPK